MLRQHAEAPNKLIARPWREIVTQKPSAAQAIPIPQGQRLFPSIRGSGCRTGMDCMAHNPIRIDQSPLNSKTAESRHSNSNYDSRYRDPNRDLDRNRRDSKDFDPDSDSDFDFDCTDVP
jgi:hypothetical protein